MPPRSYEQRARALATEETRHRIVQSTLALHAERGIEATTMKDIAQRAGVSIGTVYHHFPTYTECIRACGEHTKESMPPPGQDLLIRIAEPAARVAHLVVSWFDYYERAPFLEELRLLRHKYEPVDEFLNWLEATLQRQVSAALKCALRDPKVAPVVAVIDPAVYRSLARSGLSASAAAQAVADMICNGLGTTTGSSKSKRKKKA